MIRIPLLILAIAAVFLTVSNPPAPACCPAPPLGRAVVNGSQTVILIWDAANKTQHFIRKASFASEADDFGFLVPTPQEPELDESGEDAFDYLANRTIPRKKTRYQFSNIGCGMMAPLSSVGNAVNVLQEKIVAGLKAVVLEAKSAQALVGWLKDNGYAYSPEIETWAKPYVEAGWKMTALKVAKGAGPSASKNVAAKSLRISFKTDRPLFPYREPDPTSFAKELNVRHRLLRIYFIGEARYEGRIGDAAWSGRAVWSDTLTTTDRESLLHLLNLPETTGPATWRLTEFEDDWQYRSAPADVYFSRSEDQSTVERPPTPQYVTIPTEPVILGGIALIALAFFAVRSMLRRGSKRGIA